MLVLNVGFVALSSIQRKDVCPLLGFEGQFCAWGTFGESPRDPNPPPLKGAFLACMGGYPKHPSRGTLVVHTQILVPLLLPLTMNNNHIA